MDSVDERKSQARSWLYALLSRVESCDNVIGKRSEMGNTTQLNFIWDTPIQLHKMDVNKDE